MRKERSRLRSIHSGIDSNTVDWPDWDVVESLCNNMSIEELKFLCDQLDSVDETVEKCALIQDSNKCVTDQNQRAREERRQAAIAAAEKKEKEVEKQAQEAAQKESLLWNEEEIRLLDKAVIKYPMGTRNRWEMVAKLVRTKTIDEVIRYTKYRQSCVEMSQDKSAYEQFLQNRNKDAVIESPASVRDESPVEIKTESSAVNETNGSHSDVESISSSPKDSIEEDKKAWSKTQELALITAMKKFSKDISDRWGQIASVVPGKNKADCYSRYMELKKTFKKSKGK